MLEGKSGSPEKPLSDLGHRTYVSYWTNVILNILLESQQTNLSIMDLSARTAITPENIQYVLESYEILRQSNGKFYFFTDPTYLRKILTKTRSDRPFRGVKRNLIHWAPTLPSKNL